MKTLLTAIAFIFSMAGAANAVSVSGITMNTNNINDPVNHPYQQTENSTTQCTGQGPTYCFVYFSVQASETLIQHVSCGWNLPQGGTVASADIEDGTTGAANLLPVSSWSGSPNVAFVNTDAYLLAANGDNVEVVVGTQGGQAQSLSCTIAGYHN